MDCPFPIENIEFYNHLILSGTKIYSSNSSRSAKFYNHLILSGTKITGVTFIFFVGFTIT